jgi:dTDP-4-amino-4,6-dideoxygalactose transaminase
MRGYQDLGYKASQFPVAEDKARHIFSLPIYPFLKDEEVDAIVEVVRAAI